MSKAKKPWTEAHEREALPRTFELAAEQIRSGAYDGDRFAGLIECARSEEWWRVALAGLGLDPYRIDREVRRARALADGQLVREREERWKVVSAKGMLVVPGRTRRGVAVYERGNPPAKGDRIVKVTRTSIRRSQP